jgi:hypothetical protein
MWAMVLHHFTSFYCLENGGTILKEGLKPAFPNDFDLPPFSSIIWFTTKSDPTAMWKSGRRSDCRITVELPSTDRRLIKWGKWLHKHLPGEAGRYINIANTTSVPWQSLPKFNLCNFGKRHIAKVNVIRSPPTMHELSLVLPNNPDHGYLDGSGRPHVVVSAVPGVLGLGTRCPMGVLACGRNALGRQLGCGD